MASLSISLQPVPPFNLTFTAWALKRRAIDENYGWDGTTFRRAALIEGTPALLEVTQAGTAAEPSLQVTVSIGGLGRSSASAEAAKAAVRRLLGTETDMQDFYRVARRSENLAPLAKRFRGLKPPRYLSVFEAFINAVACQQVTLHVGLMILNRICETLGSAVPGGFYTFPSPAQIAGSSIEHLMSLGLSRNKARYMLDMASGIAGGAFDFEALDVLPNDRLMEELLSLRGVGRWSAEYMMLRGFARLDTFPMGDAGARNRLTEFLGVPKGTPVEELESYVREWHPYSGLLYFHLLLYGLDEQGLVQ